MEKIFGFVIIKKGPVHPEGILSARATVRVCACKDSTFL